MRRLVYSAIVISVSLCVASCKDAKQEVIKSAQTQVSALLKDPESAKFKDIKVYPVLDGYTVCGKVDSKNSFGGYSGYSNFRATTFKDPFDDGPSIEMNGSNGVLELLKCGFDAKWGAAPGNSGASVDQKKRAEYRKEREKFNKEILLPVLIKIALNAAN